MIEFIKHALGLCGEHHVNVWHFIIGGGTVLVYVKYKIFSFLRRKK